MNIKEIADTIIRGEKAITFPLKIEEYGWIDDSNGHHILDIRGWGFIQYAGENAEKIYNGIGQWVVDTLNRDWETNNQSNTKETKKTYEEGYSDGYNAGTEYK